MGGGCGLAYVTGPDTGSGEALQLACRKAHNLTIQMTYSLLFNASSAICFRLPLRMSKSFAFICIILLWTFAYLALSFVMETDVCVTSSMSSELLSLLVSQLGRLTSHRAFCRRLVRICIWLRTFSPLSLSLRLSFIHSVICLTTGPKPPPKRFLHIVRSRASSFKWEYPLLSLTFWSWNFTFKF